MKTVEKRSRYVPNTGMFLELFGTQADQARSVPIHFMSRAELSPKEEFPPTFQKKLKIIGVFSYPPEQVFMENHWYDLVFRVLFLSLKILKYVLIGFIFLFMFYI